MKITYGGALSLYCPDISQLDQDCFYSCLCQILQFRPESADLILRQLRRPQPTGLTFTGSLELQEKFMDAVSECSGIEVEVLHNAPTQAFIDAVCE